MKSVFIAALVAVLPALSQAAEWHQFIADSESFKVVVIIEADQSLKSSHRLQERTFANFAELACRKNSLPARGRAADTLQISITAVPIVIGGRDIGSAYATVTEFRSTVKSLANVPGQAIVWRCGERVGTTTPSAARDELRQAIEDDIEAFTLVWLASHPD